MYSQIGLDMGCSNSHPQVDSTPDYEIHHISDYAEKIAQYEIQVQILSAQIKALEIMAEDDIEDKLESTDIFLDFHEDVVGSENVVDLVDSHDIHVANSNLHSFWISEPCSGYLTMNLDPDRMLLQDTATISTQSTTEGKALATQLEEYFFVLTSCGELKQYESAAVIRRGEIIGLNMIGRHILLKDAKMTSPLSNQILLTIPSQEENEFIDDMKSPFKINSNNNKQHVFLFEETDKREFTKWRMAFEDYINHFNKSSNVVSGEIKNAQENDLAVPTATTTTATPISTTNSSNIVATETLAVSVLPSTSTPTPPSISLPTQLPLPSHTIQPATITNSTVTKSTNRTSIQSSVRIGGPLHTHTHTHVNSRTSTRVKHTELTLEILRTQLRKDGKTPLEFIPLVDLQTEVAALFALANNGLAFSESRLDYLLMCMDLNPEYSTQKEAESRAWREQIITYANDCLQIMRGFIPSDIFSSSLNALTKDGISLDLAKRIMSKKCLWLVRVSTKDISRMHVAELQGRFNSEAQGLDIVELAAIFAMVPEKFLNDDAYGRKERWRKSLEETLKTYYSQMKNKSLPKLKLRHTVYKDKAPVYSKDVDGLHDMNTTVGDAFGVRSSLRRIVSA